MPPAAEDSLERFREAQASPHAGFAVALAELRAGRKRSHWIWYVFPQLAGLGHSPAAHYFGLRNAEEAVAYLGDPELRRRLVLATKAVESHLGTGVKLSDLMGGETDSLKLVSSLTLFELAARRLDPTGKDPELADFVRCCDRLLTRAARQGFPRCLFTRGQFRPLEPDGDAL